MTKKVTLIPIDKVRILLRKRLTLKKMSRTSIYFYIQKRNFPKPLDFGVPRLWRKHEVDEWINKQLKGETKK